MTPVNWERLDGQLVEDLVAALIVLDKEDANQITASRGDRGIDIRVWTPDGFAIYQVKRYAGPLKPNQAREIEKSWRTFLSEGAPHLEVASWNLVTPWNPSNERCEWLQTLTSGANVPVNWIGRTQLDVLAANNPGVVDYFLGDGAKRFQDLMASAIAGAKDPVPGEGGEQLLATIADRHRNLASMLDEVDPFYRYEVEVQTGSLLAGAEKSGSARDRDAGIVLLRALPDDRTLVTRIFPRSRLSTTLRPIRQTVQFDTSDERHRDAVERFHQWGTPLEGVPATIVKAEGPPGTTLPSGVPTRVSILAVPTADPIDLEIRLVNADGKVVATEPLVDSEISTAPVGRGMTISGWNRSHTIFIRLRVGAKGQADELDFKTENLSGRTVASVLPAVEFVDLMDGTRQLELALAGGMAAGGQWAIGNRRTEGSVFWTDIVRSLASLQRHALSVIRVPAQLTSREVSDIETATKLIAGETVRGEWQPVITLSGTPGQLSEPTFALAARMPMTLTIDDQCIEFDRTLVFHTPEAALAPGTDADALAPGDSVRVVSRTTATLRAVPARQSDQEG